MLESALMAKISGKLMVDLFPDGTVRLAILPSVDQRNASPVTVEDLYAAEELFMMCGCAAGGSETQQRGQPGDER